MGSRYEVVVDPHAPNNSHAFLLGMVGSGKRVLELGAASGHVTRALVAQGCHVTAIEYDPAAAAGLEEFASEVIVADLNSPGWTKELPSDFEVITAGDVLEHLLDPVEVLRQMSGLLAPDGYIVVSLPHVAHADVRLSLLQGRFRYTEWGLLDTTHIRFFTIDNVKQMVADAGFVITEMKRVRVPAFESEQAVDRSAVSSVVLDEIMADPEAETYQFVFTIVRDGADVKVRAMSQRVLELEAQVEELTVQLALTAAAERAKVDDLNAELARSVAAREEAERAATLARATSVTRRRRVRRLQREVDQYQSEISKLQSSPTFRYTAAPRRAYGRVRQAVGSKPGGWT